MGAASALALGVILGWLIPNSVRFLRGAAERKSSQRFARSLIFAAVFAFALIPAAILVELVTNPLTVVSDAGVSRDRTIFHGPVKMEWNQIDQVTCTYPLTRPSKIDSIVVDGRDGSHILIGNGGVVDLKNLWAIMESRLGDEIVRPCVPSTVGPQ
jgi:hypothetical protein